MAHVLIVDDDEDIRLSLRALLEDMGAHSVLEAFDGVSGLEQLRASDDRLVVLLDLLMPRLSGLGVLRAVAADKQLATRHAYVLTTVSQEALSPEFTARLALPVEVVPKPFDITTMLDAVAEADRRLHIV